MSSVCVFDTCECAFGYWTIISLDVRYGNENKNFSSKSNRNRLRRKVVKSTSGVVYSAESRCENAEQEFISWKIPGVATKPKFLIMRHFFSVVVILMAENSDASANTQHRAFN